MKQWYELLFEIYEKNATPKASLARKSHRIRGASLDLRHDKAFASVIATGEYSISAVVRVGVQSS